ncbi:dihydrodipicolinate synthase [Myxozyma melibiosi]|uniref:Dihydrodipicolinate synthase n=1 Tax=Myxozyma melibiosi TaxID=54550 RepID=A0ABR1EXP0_9ASCO
MTGRTFSSGVYCPLVTPFKEGSYDVDFEAYKAQVLRLAAAGMGLVLHGTNGEAAHLSNEERVEMVAVGRKTLDSAGFTQVPILVGTGTGSARETVALTTKAAAAGADAAIVIHPGYYAFAMGSNKAALKAFFTECFDKSPIPVMIYNFPGAAAGIDLDSDTIIELSEHPNCFGVKLTCAGIGKGHRVVAHTSTSEYKARHPAKQEFLVLPGFSDYLFPALTTGQHGCITGTGNVFPKLIVALFNAAQDYIAAPTPEKFVKVTSLQTIVSEADWVIVKAGISGTKYALNKYVKPGLGGVTRSPLPPVSDSVIALCDEGLKKAFEVENSL